LSLSGKASERTNYLDKEKGLGQYLSVFIIIDGYNLIRQSRVLRRYELRGLGAGRQALLSRLNDYQIKKRYKITVVFDGRQEEEREEERDRYGDVDIIFSRCGEYADDVIKRLTAQSQEETIVVSSDREIADFTASLGKTALASVEFENVMNKTIISSRDKRYPVAAVVGERNDVKKKGPARRLSKAQKKRQKIMKRL